MADLYADAKPADSAQRPEVWLALLVRVASLRMYQRGAPGFSISTLEHLLGIARQAQLHAVLDAEAALFGGDYTRVAIGGASQGCCMALDAALSHPSLLAGVFASFGHVYACTARLPLACKRARPERACESSLPCRSTRLSGLPSTASRSRGNRLTAGTSPHARMAGCASEGQESSIGSIATV